MPVGMIETQLGAFAIQLMNMEPPPTFIMASFFTGYGLLLGTTGHGVLEGREGAEQGSWTRAC